MHKPSWNQNLLFSLFSSRRMNQTKKNDIADNLISSRFLAYFTISKLRSLRDHISRKKTSSSVCDFLKYLHWMTCLQTRNNTISDWSEKSPVPIHLVSSCPSYKNCQIHVPGPLLFSREKWNIMIDACSPAFTCAYTICSFTRKKGTVLSTSSYQ